jgi:hypothetical protein
VPYRIRSSYLKLRFCDTIARGAIYRRSIQAKPGAIPQTEFRGYCVAFDDLTDRQRELVITIIEELESGDYWEDFPAKCGRSRGVEIEWVLVFTTVGGAKERVSANFGRTDLHTLKDTGYVTLIQRHRDEFTCAPKQKAYEQYELHRRPLPTGEDYRIFVNYRHDDSSPC